MACCCAATVTQYHHVRLIAVSLCRVWSSVVLFQSEKKLQEFKQIAAALQPTPQPSVTAKALPALQPIPSVTAAGVAAGPTRQRLSGLLGLPEKREIGDCYIWGDWGDLEVR